METDNTNQVNEILQENGISQENEIIQENVIENNSTNIDVLDNIHNDLGIIICFFVFITLVIILKYTYKFFNMIFNF